MSQNSTPDQTSTTDSTSDVGLSLIQEPVSAETLTSKDQKQLKPVSTITSTHKELKPVSTITPTPREGRKQLPAIPDQDKQVVMASEIKQRQNASLMKNGSNGHGQFYTEYSLMAEYNLLLKQKCPGCYVVPSALTPLIWHGVLFIRQGLYQEATFRFILTVPENFPDGDCPSLVFSYPVFHPLVDSSTGELDVKRAFPKWRKNANHIWQVLLYARRVFYKIDTKLPWNKQAATLYETDMDSFKKNVEQTVKTSKEKIHDPVKSDDPHILRFTPLDPSVHEEVRKQMLSLQEKQNECNYHKGMSWMKPASVHIFTREDSASA